MARKMMAVRLQALLSGQLYATENNATLTEVLYSCIVYLTRAQIKLSLFEEHPTTDPFMLYLEGGSGVQATDSDIARGELGDSDRPISTGSRPSQQGLEGHQASQPALDHSSPQLPQRTSPAQFGQTSRTFPVQCRSGT